MSYPTVYHPENMSVKLYPHQLTAIYMMEDREKNRDREIPRADDHRNEIIHSDVGIYSDITGYGKTLAVIGLLCRDIMEWDIKQPQVITGMNTNISRGLITTTYRIQKNRINCNILVVNQSILSQWISEFSKTMLSVVVLNTRRKIGTFVEDQWKQSASYPNVIVLTPTMYNEFLSRPINTRVVWKRFIFDEPAHTKNNLKLLEASFYWFITATPDLLLNPYTRYRATSILGSIFNWHMTWDIFNMIKIKNDDAYVKQSYTLQEPIEINHQCYQPLYNMVRNYLDSIALSMIEAGDISSAVQRLGGNETSDIIELITRNKKNEIDRLKLRIQQNERQFGISPTYIQAKKDKVAKIQKEIDEIGAKNKERIDGDCGVCMDSLNKPIFLPCCQNYFCGECIFEWIKRGKNTCPLCRGKIDTSRIVHILPTGGQACEQRKPVEKVLTKNETIVKIIKNNSQGRFLLFSSFEYTFESIKSFLFESCITFKEIKGHASTRNKNIKEFKEGKIDVLFLNASYNGAGINLQEVTDIILYHEMDTDMKRQIIGRANRIGKTGSLYIHNLV